MRKILFLTGTRADFGKIKPILKKLADQPDVEAHIFITGMHLLEEYGLTYIPITREFKNTYLYNNQTSTNKMDIHLANTIQGLSHYASQIKPDLIIVHGDRPEALAGAIVGVFNNILVGHIEGGEISGTVDELVRHAVSKLSHLHFVANEKAKSRLLQLGEKENSIFVIGSPEVDIMLSDSLPELDTVLHHYEIPFKDFAIAIYHPTTTQRDNLVSLVDEYVGALKASKENYIVIHPNNDLGHDVILNGLKTLKDLDNFVLLPSVAFERFLTLLKHAKFIIGNSSSGIREAPVYGTRTINVGLRQNNRFSCDSISVVPENKEKILETIKQFGQGIKSPPNLFFGKGQSAELFSKIIASGIVWDLSSQKMFNDIEGLQKILTLSSSSPAKT